MVLNAPVPGHCLPFTLNFEDSFTLELAPKILYRSPSEEEIRCVLDDII